MDHYPYRAAIHRQFAGNVIWGPDLVDEQEPVVGGVFAGYPPDNVGRVNIEVRLPILHPIGDEFE